jgi:hypothetical protein
LNESPANFAGSNQGNEMLFFKDRAAQRKCS